MKAITKIAPVLNVDRIEMREQEFIKKVHVSRYAF